jgi:DNA-binding LytR/AlgR family response regulator
LQAIEVATKRNDDAAAEQLLRQLNELQLDGVAWQESLALKKPGGEERLQACVQELKRERETTALLKEEVQSVKDYLNALEVRIDESAARAKELTKEFDALFVSVRPET